jgi:hypothetical protein
LACRILSTKQIHFDPPPSLQNRTEKKVNAWTLGLFACRRKNWALGASVSKQLTDKLQAEELRFVTKLLIDYIIGYWLLRCNSLHLCLQYSYDIKITQLTDLMSLSTKETLFARHLISYINRKLTSAMIMKERYYHESLKRTPYFLISEGPDIFHS